MRWHTHTNLCVEAQVARDVHFFYIDHFVMVEDAQVYDEPKLPVELIEQGTCLGLKLQIVNAVAGNLNEFDANVISALCGFFYIAARTERSEEPVHRALMQTSSGGNLGGTLGIVF